MCLLSVPHLPGVPRDLGAAGLGGTPETWRDRAQCLSEADDGLPHQAQLSFQAQLWWFPIPCLPTFYTDTSIAPWFSLQAIAHVAPSVFHPPPLFSIDDPLQVSAQAAPPLWSCSRFPRRPSSCLVHPVPSIMTSIQCTVCFCVPDSNYTMSNLRAVFILIALLFSSS